MSPKLVVKAAAGFERANSSFESSSVGKMLPNSIVCHEKLLVKRSIHQCSRLHGCLILRNSHSRPTCSNHHLDHSAAINVKARSLKAPVMVCNFLATHYFLIKLCTLFLDMMLLHTRLLRIDSFYALGNQKLPVIHFIARLALSWWSGINPLRDMPICSLALPRCKCDSQNVSIL